MSKHQQLLPAAVMARDTAAIDDADDGNHGHVSPSKSYAYNSTVYLIFMLIGFSTLAPWNVILNVVPYFTSLYGDEPIATYLTSAYIYPQLPMLFFITAYGHRVSFTARIAGSLAAQVVQMVAMPLLAPTSMWVTLAIMFTNGLATAVLQSSAFGFSSQFPPIFNQALMVGQGVSGVVACVANMVVQLVLPDAKKLAALVYFAATALCLAGCIASYLYLLRMPFAQYHIGLAARSANSRGGRTHSGGSSGEGEHGRRGDGNDDDEATLLKGSGKAVGPFGEEDGGSVSEEAALPSSASLRRVLPAVGLMSLTVFLVFTMTFIMFPGIAPFEFTFQHSGLGPLSLSDTWWQLTLLTVFNVFDTAGRMAPAIGQLCGGYTLFVSVGCYRTAVWGVHPVCECWMWGACGVHPVL